MCPGGAQDGACRGALDARGARDRASSGSHREIERDRASSGSHREGFKRRGSCTGGRGEALTTLSANTLSGTTLSASAFVGGAGAAADRTAEAGRSAVVGCALVAAAGCSAAAGRCTALGGTTLGCSTLGDSAIGCGDEGRLRAAARSLGSIPTAPQPHSLGSIACHARDDARVLNAVVLEALVCPSITATATVRGDGHRCVDARDDTRDDARDDPGSAHDGVATAW